MLDLEEIRCALEETEPAYTLTGKPAINGPF